MTTRLWLSLQGPADPLLLDAGAAGERIVARMRLLLLVLLPLTQLLPGWDPSLRSAGLGLCAAGLLYAVLAHRLVIRGYRSSVGFLTGAADVSLVTTGLATLAWAGHPQLAVTSWLTFEAYFLVLGAAGLRFDWRVCSFTTALALVQYGAVVALAAGHWDNGAPLPCVPFRWSVQGARLMLLAGAGVLSAASVLRAQKLKKRLEALRLVALQQERAQQLAVVEERQRLSRDLHDSVTQLLFSMTLIAQSLGPSWRRSTAEGEAKIERLLELTQTALAEMRALLQDLRPAERVLELVSAQSALVGISRIRKEGLAAALRRYGREVTADALWIDVDDSHYEPQPLEREEVVYRIAQEAINNVAKHARARFVSIVLSEDEGALSLSVNDDGDGFDAAQALARTWTGPHSRGGGFGLIGMRERVEALRGTFQLRSEPGKGTLVRVVLPCRSDESPSVAGA
jgi:signal transduction histidine kinase